MVMNLLTLSHAKVRVLNIVSLSLVLLYFQIPEVYNYEETRICGTRKADGSIEQKWYNKRDFLCCNGTLSPAVQDGRHLRCCVTDTKNGIGEKYFEDEKMCCGHTVTRQVNPEGRKVECCDHKTTYIVEHGGLCCNGEYIRRAGENMRCCSGIQFDVRQKICCNGKLHNRMEHQRCCGQMSFRVDTQDCSVQNQVVPKFSRMCGDVQYYNNQKACCDGVLYNHTNEYEKDFGCCGKNLMNPKRERCCGDLVAKKNMWCCQNGMTQISYDPDYQKCESGIVMSSDDHVGYCGKHKQQYDTNNEHCCGDSVLSKKQKCCAGKPLPDNHICCEKDSQYDTDEKAVQKDSPLDNKCCRYYENIVTPYCDTEMKCVRGEVINRNISLCGLTPYDKDRDLCCKTSIYAGKKALGWECCPNSNRSHDPNGKHKRSRCRVQTRTTQTVRIARQTTPPYLESQPLTDHTVTQSTPHYVEDDPQHRISAPDNSAVHLGGSTVWMHIGLLSAALVVLSAS